MWAISDCWVNPDKDCGKRGLEERVGKSRKQSAERVGCEMLLCATEASEPGRGVYHGDRYPAISATISFEVHAGDKS